MSALLLLSAACGSSPSSPSSSTSVQFRLDQASCGPVLGVQAFTFSFFVDGLQVGTATLGVGQTSPAFAVAAGSHTASATVTNTTVRWQNLNFTVTKGQPFTYVLLC